MIPKKSIQSVHMVDETGLEWEERGITWVRGKGGKEGGLEQTAFTWCTGRGGKQRSQLLQLF